jgi:lipopolysaccharide transport system ATP-binding protein
MSDVVIKVENLSKQYRLGNVGTGTIAHDLNRLWYKARGKEDPYLKIGEENDRTKKGLSEYIWALKGINFEIKQGEVLGIIGRNGAGKSTLLKILSRTTSPTTGNIKIKGRVASLLEVGTGFHPELTGRENIFLNGAILGMHKQEIKQKFDEIVDFSGVERYIDTPVKRYSSGMYVRLAFAVAAHLDPEILIVDEVLAVGDAEFQKKCLGKMKDASEREGRTVLFVSHNLVAIRSLCSNCLMMNHGMIVKKDHTEEVIRYYLQSFKKKRFEENEKRAILVETEKFSVNSIGINKEIEFGESINIKISLDLKLNDLKVDFSFAITRFSDELEIISCYLSDDKNFLQFLTRGLHVIEVELDKFLLYPGEYQMSYAILINDHIEYYKQEGLIFNIIENNLFYSAKLNSRKGLIFSKDLIKKN